MPETFNPDKPFLSYEKRIDKLIDEYGLVITDRVFAKKALEKLSYYNLINGYQSCFKNPKTGQYKPGSKSTLMNAINKAEEVYNNSYAKQEEIDSATSSLNSSISTFKNNKVEEKKDFTSQMALQYLSSADHADHVNFDLHHDVYSNMKVKNGLRYYEIICGVPETGMAGIFEVYENKKVILIEVFDN